MPTFINLKQALDLLAEPPPAYNLGPAPLWVWLIFWVPVLFAVGYWLYDERRREAM